MPAKWFLGKLRKKIEEQEGAAESHDVALRAERDDQSLRYIESPSALEYAGVKRKEFLPAAKEASPEPRTDIGTSTKSELPRCPECGWAVGFEDTSCMNCGKKLR